MKPIMRVMSPKERIKQHLEFLYGEERAEQTWEKLQRKLADFRNRNPKMIERSFHLSQEDMILITYGDQFREPGEPEIETLGSFLELHLAQAINGVHLLPFFPYSSDDGFSVTDHRQVSPSLGTWKDVKQLGQHFRLMFDAVINHVSRESRWFQGFLRGEEPYKGYFITVEPGTDLSTVIRPRALPLLTEVETDMGSKLVWTTFSVDQIDLNYANPSVLLEIIDLLLFYAEHGADFIRLDAIAYLWKKPGSPSIHLPETHAIVKLFRSVLDEVAPGVLLTTETNVPHKENISYFGDALPGDHEDKMLPRGDEAQLVYQFPLAPLALHAFQTGDARALSNWAGALEPPFANTTFLNFIASHDGIGVMPAKGLLNQDQIQALVDRTCAHGGLVSDKTNPDGTKSVYELNISLYDALNDPRQPQPEVDIPRFLTSQFILLSLAGVPGIYMHSLFGTRNCLACLEETGRARSINREKFEREAMEETLADSIARETRIFSGYTKLLRIRKTHPAFHPFGGQRVLELDSRVFAVLRSAPDQKEHILCLANISDEPVSLGIDINSIGMQVIEAWQELISRQVFLTKNQQLRLNLGGYQYQWLLAEGEGK